MSTKALMWHVFIIFCWTWWPIGNFPLLVVNDSISNSVAPLLLVTKQTVAPSGGILALQYSDACRNLSMARQRIILHLKVQFRWRQHLKAAVNSPLTAEQEDGWWRWRTRWGDCPSARCEWNPTPASVCVDSRTCHHLVRPRPWNGQRYGK